MFALALLASGQNSTLTGTLAGQIVMEGFLNIRLRPWLRRLITRLIAIVPAVTSRGFRIAAVLDSDPDVVGTQIAGHGVQDVEQMEQVVTRHRVAIGVIATPAGTAQAVCDRLVATGVTSILNFAPVVLNVPAGVDVRKVDLSIELQILAFHAQRRSVVRVRRMPRQWADERSRGRPQPQERLAPGPGAGRRQR